MSIEEVSLYIFFISLGLLFYTYVGYGLLAFAVGIIRKKRIFTSSYPITIPITVIIPAYNEGGILEQKLQNSLVALRNFKDFQIILITDGSTDKSDSLEIIDSRILHLHEGERTGKSMAINKAMQHAQGDIVVITDANAMVNDLAFEKLVARFQNEKTGAVSGEKKVGLNSNDIGETGSTGGEGLYWKYESFLKRNSAKMHSLTGAAGELLAFRKSLFKTLPADAILDDMVLSLNIIRQNKVIDYEPEAFATEAPSISISDEFKRKVRISAGVFQTLIRNPFVFNPLQYSLFVFQFNSHRVMRWLVGVDCILLLFFSNLFLVGDISQPQYVAFDILFALQCVFYLMVLFGIFFRNSKNIPSIFYLPFYFIMMNAAVVVGFFRFLGRKETVLWKKAAR